MDGSNNLFFCIKSIIAREGGDNVLFIALVPKVYINFILTTLGAFIDYVECPTV